MLSRIGLGGGRVYDAVIAQCVLEAGATVLLTWNMKHFLPIAPAGLDVMEP
jgi:predicted nucleic acid-binding protein